MDPDGRDWKVHDSSTVDKPEPNTCKNFNWKYSERGIQKWQQKAAKMKNITMGCTRHH